MSRSLEFRLEAYSVPEPNTGCWLWLGCGAPYGSVWVGGRKVRAHRAALAQKLGRPVVGQANHTCDQPLCVNPEHLYEGTQADNVVDMVCRGRHKEARKTHCPAGHPYSPDNIYFDTATSGNPKRKCRTCVLARRASRYHKRRSMQEAA